MDSTPNSGFGLHSKNKVVKPRNGPSAHWSFATSYNVVQDATGFSGFWLKKFLDAGDPQICQICCVLGEEVDRSS